MSELFEAVFCGEVAADADPERVRRELEDLGVLSAAQSNEAFAGRPVVLREGLTREQADKFARALESAHARCQVLSGAWHACPACHFPQERGDECSKCGLIFAKRRERDLPPVRTRREIAADLHDIGYKKSLDDGAPADG